MKYNLDLEVYRSKVILRYDRLIFYITAIRPNIMFSVGVSARLQANPKESHLIIVKIIFIYL